MKLTVILPICFIAPLVTRHYKRARNFAALNQSLQKVQAKSLKEAITRTPIINNALKVRWSLRFICGYAPLIKQHYRWITVWETSLQWIHVTLQKPFHTITNRHLALSVKRTRTKVASRCLLCIWWKGTSQDKATSSSGEIKPITLSIDELGIS